MSDLRKAAEMALEALENPWKAKPDGVADAIIALRQALKQPKKEWVGLTDEVMRSICDCVPDYDISTYDLIELAKAIEAKLKEKNCD